jgi:sulfur carrier protein ThiS
MKIYIEKENKLLELDKIGNIKELLDTLKINSSTVITVKNNEVVLEDESLEDSDEIKILSVISGG